MRRIFPAIVLALLASCISTAVPTTWVAAERATFEAIEPEYRAYVEADPELDLAAKQNRLATLETWRVRLESHTGATK